MRHFAEWTFVVLDNDILKVAQGHRTRPGPVCTALHVKSIRGMSDDDIAKTLQAAVEVLPKKPRAVEFLLPRHFAILRTAQLPSILDAELRELATFQAVKQTPYSMDEMVLDIEILERKEDSSIVSLVVVQRELAERLLNIAQKAGLTATAIRLSTQAYEALFLAAMSRPMLAGSANKAAAFVSIDQARTHVMVMSAGKCVYSRSIPAGFGIQKDQSVPSLPQSLAGELAISFSAYRKENPGSSIQEVWFENDVSGWMVLCDYLQKEGYGKPRHLNPLGLWEQPPPRSIESETLSGTSVGDLLGAILNPPHLTLNLLPAQTKQRLRQEKRRRNIIQIVVCAAILLGLCLAFVLEKMADKKLYLHSLNKKLATIHDKASQLETRNDRIGLVNAIAQNQGEVTSAIRELYQLIPDTIALSALSYERARAIVIKGTAKELSDVFQMIPTLEKSPLFENVVSQYASKRKVFEKEYTDFQIQCSISKPGTPAASKPREQDTGEIVSSSPAIPPQTGGTNGRGTPRNDENSQMRTPEGRS